MYKAPRGTQDILPQDQPYWTYVRHEAAHICRLYGYERIDTPVFEETDLFLRSVGEGTDIVEKQMYTLGEGDLALRPEGTAPVCRAYVEHGMHSLPQPVRLYYIGPIFRYERPQAGRYRQHQQFGIEAIGDIDPALDAEVISMAWHLYESLGLTGLTLLLNSIGCASCRPVYLAILTEYYSAHSHGLCPDCRRRLSRNPLRLLDCKKSSCQDIIKEAPKVSEHLCSECSGHLNTVREHLGRLEIPYELDPHLVRGLDYYTRTVFEIQSGGLGAQSALGGGGRYDGLIEQLGGRAVAAFGFATGMERIILGLRGQGIEMPRPPVAKVYVAYLGKEAKREAIALAAKLRRAGTGVVLAVGDKSLKSQLKQANALRLPRTAIIGEDEVRKGTLILRDMTKGEQAEVPLEEAIALLQEGVD